jgi:hypothetical protein
LPGVKLAAIIDDMKKELNTIIGFRNYDKAKHLISQLENWCLDSLDGTQIDLYTDGGSLINATR